jgi:hypothetical protein
MLCSEFLSGFSEFFDAPRSAPVRQQAEAHVAECAKCARYQEVVSRGVALLHLMPEAELTESFRPRLQHRMLHLEDGGSLARTSKGSATPAMMVVGMAVLISAAAWSPAIRSGLPEVDLPAIVVSGPPTHDPRLEPDAFGRLPVSSGLLSRGLWSDAENLLYEYSSMSERYRGRQARNERVLRRTGLD